MTEAQAAEAPASNAAEGRWPIVNGSWLRSATADHLLLALLDAPDVAGTLRACAVDLGELSAVLRARIRSLPVGGEPHGMLSRLFGRPRPAFTAAALEVERIVRRAMIDAEASDGRAVTGCDCLVSLFAETQSETTALLLARGAARYDVVRFVSHGLEKGAVEPHLDLGTAEAGDRFDVVVHNDNFTPMEKVVGVLTDVFGLTREAAIALMLEIHRSGSGVAATYDDLATAREKVDGVTNFGRSHGFSLRCVVVHAKLERRGGHAQLLT